MFKSDSNATVESVTKTIGVKTDRLDGRQNADVTSKVDRFEQGFVVPPPVHIDDRRSKSFRHFPSVILWIPAKKNKHKSILCL